MTPGALFLGRFLRYRAGDPRVTVEKAQPTATSVSTAAPTKPVGSLKAAKLQGIQTKSRHRGAAPGPQGSGTQVSAPGSSSPISDFTHRRFT